MERNNFRVRINEIPRSESIDPDGEHRVYDGNNNVSTTQSPLVRVIKI